MLYLKYLHVHILYAVYVMCISGINIYLYILHIVVLSVHNYMNVFKREQKQKENDSYNSYYEIKMYILVLFVFNLTLVKLKDFVLFYFYAKTRVTTIFLFLAGSYISMNVNNILVEQDVDIGIAQMSEPYSSIKEVKNTLEHSSDDLTKVALSSGIYVDNETGEMMHGSGGDTISFMDIENYLLSSEIDNDAKTSDASHPILHSILTKADENSEIKIENEIKPETG